MPTRRALLATLGAGLYFFRTGRAAHTAPVVVISGSLTEVFADGIKGIQASLAGISQSAVVVHLKAERAAEELEKSLASGGARLLVAIGIEAGRIVLARRVEAPVVATMILRDDLGVIAEKSVTHPSASVCVDVELGDILSQVQPAIPAAKRFGTIGNPARESFTEAAKRARARGFQLQVAHAAGPEGLLPALLSLRGKADLIVCMPDSSLYNSATLTPLLRSSLENRLPLIGYSASFVRAGAAAGVFPNYYEIGVQTGDLARRILNGEASGSVESPKILNVAVNRRVMRLLGMNYQEPPEPRSDFQVFN